MADAWKASLGDFESTIEAMNQEQRDDAFPDWNTRGLESRWKTPTLIPSAVCFRTL